MDKLKHMRSFIAVVEQGSITAAAKSLGKTKALISTHITQLEALLDTRLVTRSTRSLHFSDEGLAYYEQAKQVLDDIGSLEAKFKKETSSVVGRLRISAPTTYGETILVPLISQLLNTHPELQIEMVLTDRYVDIVSEGFDATIRIGHLQDSSLIAKQIASVRLVTCASPSFLERYGQPKHPRELEQYPCVVDTNIRGGSSWRFAEEGKAFDVKLRPRLSVNSALAATRLALEGNVLTYGPDFAVKPYIKNQRLVPVLEDFLPNALPVNIIYPHRQYLSEKIKVFVLAIKVFLENPHSISSGTYNTSDRNRSQSSHHKAFT